MKIKRLAAACMTILMLCGCSQNDITEKTEDAQISDESSVTFGSDGYIQTEKTELPVMDQPAQDMDPEALDKSNENVPFFFGYKNEEVTFEPTEESVKFSGRHIEYKGVTYLSYTCSAVSFVMTGDRAEAVMVSNGEKYSSRQQGWVGVMIDGELKKRIQLEDGENSYVLYEGDQLENAEISIIKLSENQMAVTGVKSITCNASRLSPAADKELMIEFIGDSLTCGYGNEANSPSDGLNTSQQNGTATYGFYTASDLGADWSMVCVSGIGAVSDYTDEIGHKEDYLLVEDMYEYKDSNFQMRRGFEKDSWEKWDFGEGSDIVVINIGTNDITYTGSDEDLRDEFADAYYEILVSVRENNPDAHIICTLGISGAELWEEVVEIAESFADEYKDNKIHTMKFEHQREEDGYGGDYHPTVKSHRRAADKLTEFIRLNCQ